ncbi:MAG TPA: type VI secretion system tip protein TssI/VgrG [Polyangiaceae bacterium]|jgi:type VI secretion system secreted protein VgrG|nr:type VI secretion system tip protein TssI/VgrG [Polyangiaceae bacterium]
MASPQSPTGGIANLSVTIDSGDTLHVRDFDVHEKISALFSITLTVASDNHDIDFEAAVGRPASFTMYGGLTAGARPRAWHGIVSQLHQLAVEEEGHSTYHLEIVPTLWFLTQRRNYRIFQQLSELEIALELLEEWGIEPVKRLTGRYKKRKYRVQYAESDYNLFSRVLEDVGISFYFEQEGEQTRLVLADAPHANPLRDPKIAFRDEPTTVSMREHVTAVRIGRKVRPGRYTVRDHDYRRPPEYRLAASAAKEGLEERLERFHYTPGAFLFEYDRGEATPSADDKGRYRTDEGEAGTIAQKRLAQKRGDALVCTFETNVIDLAPGVVMSMLDHPRADLAPGKRLLVVEAGHSGSIEGEWQHHCEVRSAELPFHPPMKTPRPKVIGCESATVVGPPGEEIHTDEFGRVRVHFHWDRESTMNDNSSCWIHVSQPWGGAGYGGVNLPRIGQEVLVEFLGGDPDRPIIIGRVYTNLQKVPYGLPANKTQSGLKSNSTNNTGGYNEMMFEDAAGREMVRMQAERDLHKLVKRNEDVTVGNDRTKVVKNCDSLTVGKDREKKIVDNETVEVGLNRTTNIGQIDTTTAGAKHVITISPGRCGAEATTTTHTDGKIVFTTGQGATITMEGSVIKIEAEMIHVVSSSGTEVASLGGDVFIHGGPMVKINP